MSTAFGDNLTLQTNRLIIRPLTQNDKRMFVELHTDAKIMKNNDSVWKADRAEKSFAYVLKQHTLEQPKCIALAIYLGSTVDPVGLIVLHNISWHAHELEMGIMLMRKFHGKQYPEEALIAAIDFCIDDMNFRKVIGVFQTKNLAAARYLRKIGFEFTEEGGELTKGFIAEHTRIWR